MEDLKQQDQELAQPVKTGTELLLEQVARIEEARQFKTLELLEEKTNVVKFAMERDETIKNELKALGYKAPRKKSENSPVIPPESLDKSQVVG